VGEIGGDISPVCLRDGIELVDGGLGASFLCVRVTTMKYNKINI
jgi:hypothetical protein